MKDLEAIKERKKKEGFELILIFTIALGVRQDSRKEGTSTKSKKDRWNSRLSNRTKINSTQDERKDSNYYKN